MWVRLNRSLGAIKKLLGIRFPAPEVPAVQTPQEVISSLDQPTFPQVIACFGDERTRAAFFQFTCDLSGRGLPVKEFPTSGSVQSKQA